MPLPGFNLTARPALTPLQLMTPQELTAAASAAFRPGALMGQAPLAMGGGAPHPGFSLGEGIALAGRALDALGKPDPNVAAQRAAPTYDKLDPTTMPSTSSIDRALDPSLGSIPGNDVMPPTIMGQPDSTGFGRIIDFLTGWLR
jgi:hypothetical protein